MGEEAIIVSWSQLRTHEMCRQKHHLKMMRRESPTQDVTRFFSGVVVDRLARRYMETEGKFDIVGSVEQMFDQQEASSIEAGKGTITKDPTQRARMRKKALDCVTLLKPILDEKVLPFEYKPERWFRINIELPSIAIPGLTHKVQMRGGVDIVVRHEDGSFCGYDVKATTDPGYHRKMAGQPVFYDLAHCLELGAGTPYKEFAYFQPLIENNPIQQFHITEEDRNQMIGRIIRMADDIHRGIKDPKATTDWECQVCEVKHGCEKFDPVRRKW